jgi:hypothetical protein
MTIPGTSGSQVRPKVGDTQPVSTQDEEIRLMPALDNQGMAGLNG